MDQDAEGGDVARRFLCFAEPDAVADFDASFRELLQSQHGQMTPSLLPKENVHRYNHGGNWDEPTREGAPQITMVTLTAKMELPYQALIENDLGAIRSSVEQIVRPMDRQFAQMMYGAVGKAAENVGNVIDAKEQPSLAEAFAAGLEKIEFGVDRKGEVTLPEFHVGPDMHKKAVAALEAQQPEYGERIKKLIIEKSEQALAREVERKARFKGLGG